MQPIVAGVVFGIEVRLINTAKLGEVCFALQLARTRWIALGRKPCNFRSDDASSRGNVIAVTFPVILLSSLRCLSMSFCIRKNGKL